MESAPQVLVVEDERMIARAIGDLLADEGYQVCVATSGGEAFELLCDHKIEPIAIVTDIRLGSGPSGWEVARRAREVRPDFPVLYISADSSGDYERLGVPGSAMLPKPFTSNQFLSTLSSLI